MARHLMNQIVLKRDLLAVKVLTS